MIDMFSVIYLHFWLSKAAKIHHRDLANHHNSAPTSSVQTVRKAAFKNGLVPTFACGETFARSQQGACHKWRLPEKNAFFRALPEWMEGGGGLFNFFLASFKEVHFWSIKWVYFFQNTNILNFRLFLGSINIVLCWFSNLEFRRWNKAVQVARNGGRGGGGGGGGGGGR